MDLETKISTHIDKLISKKRDKSLLQVRVFSEKLSLDIKKSDIDPDKPFHVASIGKVFTATLIGMLVDRGDIGLDDKVSTYLSDNLLEGLFVDEYRHDITLRHLLGHTSGVADYFEGPVVSGMSFLDRAFAEPDKIWKPIELVEFTKNSQKPFGSPGKFHYSDTGYVLLGLIIEKVTGKAFDNALDEMIFKPLNMGDSYLMFYKKPAKEIAPVWFSGVEISRSNLLSCDWAGGGIVSTLDDLLKFQRAYWKGGLVSQDYINEMSKISSKFRTGMYYGLGLMELRFHEFFFLLKGLPQPKGHSGILGTLMFYDKDNDLHFVLNMGSPKKIPNSIRLFIQIEALIKKATKT